MKLIYSSKKNVGELSTILAQHDIDIDHLDVNIFIVECHAYINVLNKNGYIFFYMGQVGELTNTKIHLYHMNYIYYSCTMFNGAIYSGQGPVMNRNYRIIQQEAT